MARNTKLEEGGPLTQRFLSEAFGEVPPNLRFLLWTFPQRASSWYSPSEVEQATIDSERWPDRDVYVGVGLSPGDLGPRRRCEAKDIAGIVGLWADIDYADDVHRKAHLPPNEKAAVELLKAMGPTPTCVIHSGHGLQAWWLFEEPWIFDTPAEYDTAAKLTLRWNYTLRVHAAEHNWVIDSVFDLSRVMRLPGTTNCKAERVPVRALSWDGDRYNPSDFDEYLADESAVGFLSAPYRVQTLHLVADADVGATKLSVLLENVPKAKATWERTGRQLPSASEWDLSIASFAAQAEWTDQEIADLLIAYRRKHNEEPKVRQSYIAKTIAKARTTRVRDEQEQQIHDVLEDALTTLALEGASATPTPDALRAKRDLLNVVAARLGGIPLAAVERAVGDPPTFTLVFLNGRRLLLGDGGQIATRFVAICGLIEGETRVPLPSFKRIEWKDISQAMIHASEDVEVSEDATHSGQAVGALTLYLRNRPLLLDRHEAAEVMEPFVEGQTVYVFATAFASALERRGERLVKGMHLNDVMRAAGCEYVKHFNVRVNSKKTQRSVWILPATVVDEIGLELPSVPDADQEASP